MKKSWILFACFLIGSNTFAQKSKPTTSIQNQVEQFLKTYNQEYVKLSTVANEADWESQTKIIEGDTLTSFKASEARKALASFTGSIQNIEAAKKFLAQKKQLQPLQIKQLERVLYVATNNPETVKELVAKRINAETQQTQNLFGFDFKIEGKSVSANDIDEALKNELDLNKRLAAWNASKDLGIGLKDGLENLRELRNKTVQGLGYSDYFTYQVSEYGMSNEEMIALLRKINQELMPLYRELHTYARYELAKKYNVQQVPDMIPAHWLSNRWGQDWSDMVDVAGVNLDSVIKTKGSEWIVKQGERFYMSMGFPPLPASFYAKSDLYPLPANVSYKKNNHASAWHIDYQNDVRSLMSVIPNTEWYETSHHELGHIYYYIAYTNPNVPPLLREGANRAYHEAMGSLMGLASMQKPFLENLNLIEKGTKTDEMRQLLKEALNYVVFIPWSAGVMTEFEYELYSKNLPKNQFNQKWWELVSKYQGITPPTVRGENYCDAATKTHINDDAAQYYDYALSFVLLFQLHDHIAKQILKQDPRATNYYGNKEVGEFINDIMTPGASKDWRTVLKEKTGSDLSAKAMLDYFAPLMEYLKKENAGRKYTL